MSVSGLPTFFISDCTPNNFDVPQKMKVKGYMYPQMKKPVGMLTRNKNKFKLNKELTFDTPLLLNECKITYSHDH
jgi:hypothetical protein